jgi:ABC-2 type transport system ATP-binding protein
MNDTENNVVIAFDDVTKDYGNGRGIFAVTFDVHRGECFGLVGENGAGKTTTLRHIMGFIRPNSGHITVLGKNAFDEAQAIKKNIGYVPGEISLPPLRTGKDVLLSQMALLGRSDFTTADRLISLLQLNITAYPKRMSKGMKQKMALVMALMAEPDILILDEPTTGLDPLMKDQFLNVLLEQKKLGRTILMSSNLYDELELLCDRVALISQGHLKAIADNNAIKTRPYQDYKIEFLTPEDYARFKAETPFRIKRDQQQYHQVTVEIPTTDVGKLFGILKNYAVRFLTQTPYDLETYFRERNQGVTL